MVSTIALFLQEHVLALPPVQKKMYAVVDSDSCNVMVANSLRQTAAVMVLAWLVCQVAETFILY
jgi:hypothetical protein